MGQTWDEASLGPSKGIQVILASFRPREQGEKGDWRFTVRLRVDAKKPPHCGSISRSRPYRSEGILPSTNANTRGILWELKVGLAAFSDLRRRGFRLRASHLHASELEA